MNNLWMVFIKPHAVFSSMKDGNCSFLLPVVALVVMAVIFLPLKALNVSDEAMIQQAEKTLTAVASMVDSVIEDSDELSQAVEEMKSSQSESAMAPDKEQSAAEEGASDEFTSNDDEEVSTQTSEGVSEVTSIADIADQVFDTLEDDPELQEQLSAELTKEKYMSALGSPIGALFKFIIVALVMSTYFMLVGKTMGNNASWEQWWGFTFWSFLTTGLYWIGLALVTVFTGVINARPHLAPLSWFGMSGGFLLALNIPMFIAVYIQTEGLRAWTERPALLCFIVVLIPWLLWSFVMGSVSDFFGNFFNF